MTGWSRRRALRGLGSVTALAGLGASGLVPSPAIAQAVGWGKLKGQTIRVAWPLTRQFDLAKALIADFVSATGIKVELDMRSTTDIRQPIGEELAKPFGNYDLVAYDATWKAAFGRRGWLTDLASLLKNADLAMPGFDFADLVSGYVDGIGVVGGRRGYLPGPGAKLVGIPFGVECAVLAYRGDLMEKHKLKVPKTYEDLLAAVATIHGQEKGIGGLTTRAKPGDAATTAWLLHLAAYGGSVIDDAFLPHIADAPAVQAAETLKTIVDTGPPGGSAFDASEMMSAFLQGQAAMYLDSVSVFGPAADPERTKLTAKIGYAVPPKAAAHAGAMWGYGLAIPANSVRKDAAFVLLQWLTAKAQDVKLTARGGFPGRLSTLDNPDVKKRYPVDILRECIKVSNPDWRPLIEEWPEISERVIGPRLGAIMAGTKQIPAALQEASGEILKICQRAGYYRT